MYYSTYKMRFTNRVPYLFILSILSLNISIWCRECSSSDFSYHYTDCDSRGQRWLYAVPKSHLLAGQCTNVPQPREGLNCSFSCPTGNFLDMETQQCRVCPAGTYSLGNGVRYEQFTEMPTGFSVENYPDESDKPVEIMENGESTGGEEAATTRAPAFCSNQIGWVVQNDELRYTPTPCISKLSISLNLIKDGYIEFYYKMPKNSRSLVAIIQVKNAQCQNYGDSRSMFLQAAHLLATPSRSTNAFEDVAVGEDGFRARRIHIRAGQNLLTWTVASNSRELTTLADIIHVPKIDIFGLAFTPSCTNCPIGTYSHSGANKCDSCPSGTFSRNGSPRCGQCSEYEYSGPRASKCQRRPNCKSSDYYSVRSNICQNGSQSVSYEKIKPEVCVESGSSPAKKKTEQCSACNPGMSRDKTTGKCKYCDSAAEYSDDGLVCKKCPDKSVPESGYFFTHWDILPAEVSTTCEYISPDEGGQQCDVAPAWIPLDDRIESAQTRATGVALELSVKVSPGFFNPLRMGGLTAKPSLDNPVGYVSIDIEMVCADQTCQLYFVQERINASLQNHFDVIAALNGTQARRIFRYPIVENSPTQFVVAFMRSGSALERDALTDRAIIYSFNVSNIGDPASKKTDGGAAICVRCPNWDEKTKECRPCDVGHFWNDKDSKCIKCPPGTALNLTSSRIGLSSCTKCGANLGSEDGSSCSFSGRFQLPSPDDSSQAMKFDLTPLRNRTFTAEGIKVYAREGNSYYHTFNVSLFGEAVRCQDSFDTLNSGHSVAPDQSQDMSSHSDDVVFCRSAAIPASILGNVTSSSSDVFSKVLHVSTTVLSRKLVAVTQNRTFGSFHLSNEQLEYDSTLTSSTRPIDLHFFYEPSQVSTRLSNCPHGTIGVVTARCDPKATKNPLARLSRKCPDGTCDGCVYHIIAESSYACPICHPEDFEEIRGECLDNVQQIHYIPSKHCVLSGAQNRLKEETCSNISKNVKLMLLVAALVIACLGTTVVIFYQRNKSLEYRYMRIIEGKEPDNVHSCGLASEDEDEEDEVAGTRVFFGKKKNNYVVSVSKDPKAKAKSNSRNKEEVAEFLSDSSDDG